MLARWLWEVLPSPVGIETPTVAGGVGTTFPVGAGGRENGRRTLSGASRRDARPRYRVGGPLEGTAERLVLLLVVKGAG